MGMSQGLLQGGGQIGNRAQGLAAVIEVELFSPRRRHLLVGKEQSAQAGQCDIGQAQRWPPVILPGGGRAAADCHMARAICRRAERRVVSLAQSEEIGESVQVYLNRLSDLLFVLCRILARDEGGVEVLWRNPGRTA